MDGIGTKRRRVLGKTVELAGPHFVCVVIVHDGIIRFEVTVVEVLVLVNARIIVMGKAWSYVVQEAKVSVEQSVTNCFPQRQSQNFVLSCGSI